jgi:glutaminyl-peptide cyclotransferase
MHTLLFRALLATLLATLLLAGGAAQAALPVYGFFVKNTYPHDPEAFTQGLLYHDGALYESTGLQGRSSLRKVALTTGKVLRKTAIDHSFFGEGIALVNGELDWLTWQNQVGFVYDLRSFKEKRRFHYAGEGWGLASDARHVYQSDGTDEIRVLDPNTLAEQKRIKVTAEGKPVNMLNELEIVDGELFANMWGSDVIARIDPACGNVVGWIDLSGLLPDAQRGGNPDAVLNGIAWDAKGKRLFVTGKLWPTLFEIELIRIERP